MTRTIAAACGHREPAAGRDRFLRDVLLGLRGTRKTLPCKYFYDEAGSALFDAICDLDEYYLTRTETDILRAHAGEMADEVGEDVDLVELGSGSSLKTRLLLERLRSPRAYLPVDISGEHLDRSARALARRFPGLRVEPVHADFTLPISLPDTGAPRARRVAYFPGSTIGNFGPAEALGLLKSIARLVGPGGGLLIGFDLDKDESIVLPAYNDAKGVTAAFNLNVLKRINRELGGDFDLDAFAHRAIYLRDRERVEMHLVSLRRQVATIGGGAIEFAEGETIHTESSHKYRPEHFARLAERAGFAMARGWTDARGYFAVQYLAVP